MFGDFVGWFGVSVLEFDWLFDYWCVDVCSGVMLLYYYIYVVVDKCSGGCCFVEILKGWLCEV